MQFIHVHKKTTGPPALIFTKSAQVQ